MKLVNPVMIKVNTLLSTLIVSSVLFACGDNQPNSPTKLSALVMSQELVKQKLKAPSTAEFGATTDDVQQLNDSTFIVNGFVDSENTFGAKLRSNYSATIIFKNDGTAYSNDITLIE